MKRYRKFIVILFLTAWVSPGYSQEYAVVEADRIALLEQQKSLFFKGIKYQTDWEYVIIGGNVTTEKVKLRIHKFDGKGRIDETTHLKPNGLKEAIDIHVYTNKGLPDRLVSYTPEGSVLEEVLYRYNKLDQLTDVTWYTEEGFTTNKITFEVDANENTVTQRNWYSPDSIELKYVFHYASLENGPVTQIDEYNGENNVERIRIIKRFENGQIDREEHYDGSNELILYLKYSYNPHEQLVMKERIYTTGARSKHSEFNYTPQGLLMAVLEYNQKGEIQHYFKYTYH